MKKIKGLVKVLLAVTVAASLTACGGAEQSSSASVGTKDGDVTVLKLGLNGTDYRVWDSVNERLKKDNIRLEMVSFSDYVKPNQALNDGEIDLNAFQTEIYLKDFCKKHNMNLEVLTHTAIYPLAAYSNKITDVKTIKDGGKIAIPNDTTNGGRALQLLAAQGLITLKDPSNLTPTIKDVSENPKNLEIIEMTAGQIPRALDDVDFAIINNGVASDAGLTLKDSAIVVESLDSETVKNYYNVIAVKAENKDNEAIQKVKEVYTQEATRDVINEIYNGQCIPVF